MSAHACLGLVIEDSEVSRTRSGSRQKQNLGECESLCGSDGTDLQPQLLQSMQQDPMFHCGLQNEFKASLGKPSETDTK